ncbi:MAG: universal stress protein [Desulfobacterales bacterium]|nr:MAG: universal stress protein [Desulfobacterales bacterium]
MYQRILVPLDGSELAEQVLPHVEAIVKGGGVQEVIFFRVVEPYRTAFAGVDYVMADTEMQQMLNRREENARDYLNRLTGRLQSLGVSLTAKVTVGRADESIVDLATHEGVDLIVMATHGRSGVSRWVMGSVADRIVRWSCVPVLLIRPPACVPKI